MLWSPFFRSGTYIFDPVYWCLSGFWNRLMTFINDILKICHIWLTLLRYYSRTKELCNYLKIQWASLFQFHFVYLGQLEPEAVVQRCSVKKLFIKISQNLQENKCLRPVTLLKNLIHVKKVGHTPEFLFDIYWWTWKTTFY